MDHLRCPADCTCLLCQLEDHAPRRSGEPALSRRGMAEGCRRVPGGPASDMGSSKRHAARAAAKLGPG